MKVFDTIEGIAAAVASVGAAVLAVVRFWGSARRWRQRRARSGHLAAIEANHAAYGILASLLHELPFERILVYKSHNGGGVPKLGSTILLSVAFELHTAKLPSVRESVQSFPLDGPHQDVLAEVMRARLLSLAPNDLPDCFLRRLYEAHGVRRAFLASIGFSESSFYYFSGELTDGADKSARIQTNLALAAQRIAALFELLPQPPRVPEPGTEPT